MQAGAAERRPIYYRRVWGLAFVILLALGFLTTQQIRVMNRINRSHQVEEGRMLSALLAKSAGQTQALAAQIHSLQTKLKHAPQASQSAVAHAAAKVQAARAAAGDTAVSGPGVQVVIHDQTTPVTPGEPAMLELVHDQYVLHVVGLLSSTGATAIAVNGQRYTSSTAIYCSGPTIRVNGIPEASPYVVTAVGPQNRLLQALHNDPYLLGWSELLPIQIKALSRTTIPAFTGTVTSNQAKAGTSPQKGLTS